MKKIFVIPETPTCRVVYERNGVKYGAVIQTPHSNDALQMVLLTRKVGISEVRWVESITPPKPLYHPHPAQSRISRFAVVKD